MCEEKVIFGFEEIKKEEKNTYIPNKINHIHLFRLSKTIFIVWHKLIPDILNKSIEESNMVGLLWSTDTELLNLKCNFIKISFIHIHSLR